MNTLLPMTAVLMLLIPCALTSEPNGSLRMAIARWAESKGTDLRRVVRRLDNSKTKIEPNEPYVVHGKNNPLSRGVTSAIVWRQNFTEPGTYSLTHTFKKKLSATWNWSRQHNMDYLLNISQPVYIKVPDDSKFTVDIDGHNKDFWEFNTPLPWNEAEATCRAAGLKLAQPKTKKEVEGLTTALHNRVHKRPSGCLNNATWFKKNGYCFFHDDAFVNREDAIKKCESLNSTLPFPALGAVAAWSEAVKDSIAGLSIERGRTTHAGGQKGLDSQWVWQDESVVQEEAWTPGKPAGNGDCSVMYSSAGKLIDKGCSTTWYTLCQGYTSNHWLGALRSNDKKCSEWVGGKCIEKEDHDPNSNIEDLWQIEQPDYSTSSNYALLLQIEHEKPLTIMKTSERKPFLCEAACPLGFINLGNHCLLVQKYWLTWHEAHAACVKNGLQLYKTENTSDFSNFLHSHRLTGTYWIGGSERNMAGKEVDMTIIKKLQFICELAHGTREMNVTSPLSYSDQATVNLPKVVTPSINCTVTVKEKIITETYPFSVQMDITGWLWVEYNRVTDEHGSYHCDNNNDWVSGEECFAHSKWGYSTSYLQDGDQIMAQGDNARLTLNGTVTYTFNEHEVDTTQCGTDELKNSRRRKRSIASSGKSIKKLKARANSQDVDDNNKPLMSYIGKRVAEWVRSQAKEKKAHLVAYTIDQLSPTVTDMKIENDVSELIAPGSIFEEEFENNGNEPVITTFSKMKNIANSYRWSVSKGLSMEDSHISSYSMTNTQSESNTFSLSNNVAQTEETNKMIRQGTSDSSSNTEGTSQSEAIGSSLTETDSETASFNKGGASSGTSSQTNSVGETVGSSVSSGTGSSIGGSKTSGETDSRSSGTSDTSSNSEGKSTSDTQSNTKTITDSKSQSSTQGTSESTSQSKETSQSNTQTQGSSTRDSSSSEVTAGGEAGVDAWGFSAKVSFSATARNERESTKTKESSSTSSSEERSSSEKSVSNEKTATQEQSNASETGQTAEQTNTSEQSKSKENTVGQENTKSSEEAINHEVSNTSENTSNQEKTSQSEVSDTIENTKTFDITQGTDRGSSVEKSINRDTSINYESIRGRENSYDVENSIIQERTKNIESLHGGDVSKDSQSSQETQKSKTHQVNIDRNEDIETSEEETLETINEVTIPGKKIVKIEWKVQQRKVRLPWKATIQLTGWINVRFKNDDKVCDIHRPSGWTYNYTSLCEEDNRLYGYPLSYIKDKNYIQSGNGIKFVASGVFEAVLATSHFLRVTETSIEDDDDDDDDRQNDDYYYYDDAPRPSRRRKRAIRRLPSKVTDYHLDFDKHGKGKANIGKDNRYFRKFHATKRFK